MRQRLSDDSLSVYRMLRYSMGWSDANGDPVVATEGKALRPTLCLFACEAAGGRSRTALSAAVSLELIHNFSLIHDDIQDRDETRHHRPTLWKVWGDSRALVAGSTLNMLADMALMQLTHQGVGHQRSLDAAWLLTEAYLKMIEGQYLDISFEGRRDIGITDYLDMISKKTGALIRCAMHLGALIGSDDPATIEAFRECGRSLGFVFQIRDDVLGIWGDQVSTGKPVGADIRRRKNTLPLVYAMSRGSGADQALLEDVYRSSSVDDRQVESVLDLLDRVGASDYARDLAAEHSERAMDALEVAELGPEALKDIEELVYFLQFREH